ncbi:hypothetical protein EC973_005264 [Apophysomyces ossiformis]|uniref:Uncharacterized protein n=1 Tax=Apophysomyces ossiformis TaxID=679940 RepID=A0A8H7BY30_9FUNG|nr:hypothetical protein EC973_005264 [Apophysomyces ossiformis]
MALRKSLQELLNVVPQELDTYHYTCGLHLDGHEAKECAFTFNNNKDNHSSNPVISELKQLHSSHSQLTEYSREICCRINEVEKRASLPEGFGDKVEGTFEFHTAAAVSCSVQRPRKIVTEALVMETNDERYDALQRVFGKFGYYYPLRFTFGGRTIFPVESAPVEHGNYLHITGGDAWMLFSHDMQDWKETIKTKPAVIGLADLQPIYTLLDEQQQNQVKEVYESVALHDDYYICYGQPISIHAMNENYSASENGRLDLSQPDTTALINQKHTLSLYSTWSKSESDTDRDVFRRVKYGDIVYVKVAQLHNCISPMGETGEFVSIPNLIPGTGVENLQRGKIPVKVHKKSSDHVQQWMILPQGQCPGVDRTYLRGYVRNGDLIKLQTTYSINGAKQDAYLVMGTRIDFTSCDPPVFSKSEGSRAVVASITVKCSPSDEDSSLAWKITSSMIRPVYPSLVDVASLISGHWNRGIMKDGTLSIEDPIAIEGTKENDTTSVKDYISQHLERTQDLSLRQVDKIAISRNNVHNYQLFDDEFQRKYKLFNEVHQPSSKGGLSKKLMILYVVLWKLRLDKDTKASQKFEEEIAVALQSSEECTTKDKLTKAFYRFGHFSPSELLLGGRISVECNDASIKDCFSRQHHFKCSTEETIQKFKIALKQKKIYEAVGGDVSLLESKLSLEQWIQSIEYNPKIVQFGRIRPTYELLEEKQRNAISEENIAEIFSIPGLTKQSVQDPVKKLQKIYSELKAAVADPECTRTVAKRCEISNRPPKRIIDSTDTSDAMRKLNV